MNNLKDKKVLVVGMGKSGIAATQALLKLEAVVSVNDSKSEDHIDSHFVQYLKNKNVACYLGKDPQDMEQFDMLVLSPGVPLELPFIKEAKEKGVEIVGELEIAYRVGSGKYVAITGTNGKTTTTTLVGKIFKDAGRWTYVVGNIGVAVISKSLEAKAEDWLITETSSFQLETIKSFRPVISALLNITPDHLDRHKSLENYAEAKALIFKNQEAQDFFIVNYDDAQCMRLAKKCKATVVPFSRKEELTFGCYAKEGRIFIKNQRGNKIEVCGIEELQIPGTHNLENALAAVAICYFSGIEETIIAKSLREFQGVEHRLEFVGEIDGIRFVNDSKGTNPDASIKAIEAMNGGVVLIAGGYDKASDFREFVKAFSGKVKHMVLLGETAGKIKAAAESIGFTTMTLAKDMDECVKVAYKLAEPGDTVLLSPACASWDMYTCFEQRGEHFKNCVRMLEE